MQLRFLVASESDVLNAPLEALSTDSVEVRVESCIKICSEIELNLSLLI